MVSFAYPSQIPIAAQVCQSFALDNGAFSFWRAKQKTDWQGYYQWLEEWLFHPACDWALIPDVIEGSEKDNDRLIKKWPFGFRGVPVWHLNESPERLVRLSEEWPIVALGSSGEYDVANFGKCLDRLRQVLPSICNKHGFPKIKLHGLRMLRPDFFTQIPLSSADSTMVARNIGLDVHWKGNLSLSKGTRGIVMVDHIEHFNATGKIKKTYNKLGFGL